MLVTRNVVTKDEVIAAIREVAEKLGRSPRYPEVIRVVNVTRRQIHRIFGGWAAALQESGCERLKSGGTELTMQELWQDWVAVARKVERIPTIRQYEKFGRYSVRPLKDRFKAWDRVAEAMLEYGNVRGLWTGWDDVKTLIEQVLGDCTPGQRYKRLPKYGQNGHVVPEVVDVDKLYAEPLNLDPMAMAPENELGVIFLFGVMARELGFVVLKMRAAFPDCEALRRMPNGKWQRVRIEFEYQSKSFLAHGHNPNGCDLIVCWEHDWRGCGLEVLELRKVLTADFRG